VPSIVGNIKINSVGPSSNVQIGDTAFVVLSSNSKINAGANSFAPGDSFGGVFNYQNSSTIDPDLVDNTNMNALR
jgi:spore germination protein PA